MGVSASGSVTVNESVQTIRFYPVAGAGAGARIRIRPIEKRQRQRQRPPDVIVNHTTQFGCSILGASASAGVGASVIGNQPSKVQT